MNNVFYVSPAGVTDDRLPLYYGWAGDWHIAIVAAGVTRDNVDWQFVGLMYCDNVRTLSARRIGLIWDESRTLTDIEGEHTLSMGELDALALAGLDVSNFAPRSRL